MSVMASRVERYRSFAPLMGPSFSTGLEPRLFEQVSLRLGIAGFRPYTPEALQAASTPRTGIKNFPSDVKR